MARQIPFTRHEAVLLLDAYLKVLSSKLPRMDSVKECSRMLRLMAVNSGMRIDDIYRNVNGISFQMASMESAYQGRTIKKPATRLFTEVVNLYKTDNREYRKLLMEARNMAERKQNNESAFLSWLSQNVSSAKLSELYLALIEIEQQAKKDNLLQGTIFDDLELSLVKRIKAKIEQSQSFRFAHKKQWKSILSALNYILQYANSKVDEVIDSNQSQIEVFAREVHVKPDSVEESPDIIEEHSFLDKKTDIKIDDESVFSAHDNSYTVDFNDIDTLAFSKPISICYFGNLKEVSSWKSVYVDACRFLLDDYPDTFFRMLDDCINGKGKVWMVDEKHLDMLAVPKRLKDDRYVETNRSASDLVKNLKWILDKCSVDYENVVITYLGRKKAMRKQNRTPNQDQTERQYYCEDKESFFQWLRQDQHMAEATCRSYASAIISAEKFAKEHGITTSKLYTKDLDEAKTTADALFANPEFIQYNNDQHNRFRAAITKLLAFYGCNLQLTEKTNSVRQMKSEPPLDTASYSSILVERFPKGYRLGSTLDMKRFRRYYEELTGLSLSLEQSKVESAVRKCGIVYDGRLFMPQTMLSIEIKEQVISSIERCFDEGRTAVYYEALFREFSEIFLDHQIYNSEMLKAYLAYYLSDKYYMGRSYLSKETRAEVDPIDEVRQCLKQYETPMRVDDICDILSHIAKDRVRYILRANGEFVRNSKGEYFHVDSFDLTDEELENIAGIIDFAIEEHEFISGNELYDAIHTKYPYTFEKNAAFSMIGWRDALKYRIGDRFSFVGNIISRKGTSLSMSDVFSEYGRGRLSFTIEELDQFADSIGTTIYFDSLYTYAIRISHQRFVAKKNVRFSVKETDSVLERLCEGDYIPLSSVKEFAIFPNASYPWTEYLLEQYVAYFSEKFYLCHGNYNKNSAVGAIVKKSCRYNSFDELVTDILAHSNIPLQKKEVLDYLVETGYIARRSYTNIEALVINARAKRNLKEKK